MADDTLNNESNGGISGSGTSSSGGSTGDITGGGSTDVGGAEMAPQPEDLTLPASADTTSYNGWQTVTDWLSVTPMYGTLPTNSTISFNAKTKHTGRLQRTGTLTISYWGASEADKKTQTVTIKQKGMDTYSATDFWICVPKNNSYAEYVKYPTKAECTITIASDVNHIKLLTRTNASAATLENALSGLEITGPVLKYDSASNSSHFYNCTLDKSLHNNDIVPNEFTGDLLDKFTEKAYMYIATEITVNNITSVSESGTIHIANNIQHWGDERINRIITIKKTQAPTFNMSTPSDIEADSTGTSNITLSGTPGTNWSSTLS